MSEEQLERYLEWYRARIGSGETVTPWDAWQAAEAQRDDDD